MTYLQIINAVLKRLREDAVTGVSDTTYSAMLAEFVNDAKGLVEDAWQWSAQRTRYTITTADGTAEYSLTNSSNRCLIESVWDESHGVWLQERNTRFITEMSYLSGSQKGSPNYWAASGVDGSGDTQITLHLTPDDAYTIYVDGFQRQADLSDANDVLVVPSQPVMLLTYAMAIRERGEVGGQTVGEAFKVAQQALSDAISRDAALDHYQLDWTVE